jgi:hypothetical protein
MGDHGLALSLKQLDQPLLLGDQGVDLGSFVVEEGGDRGLLLERRKSDGPVLEFFCWEPPSARLAATLAVCI